MASPSRRLQTKPVITCFKSVLLIYTFIFWVRNGGPRGQEGTLGLGWGCDPERREHRSGIPREARGRQIWAEVTVGTGSWCGMAVAGRLKSGTQTCLAFEFDAG